MDLSHAPPHLFVVRDDPKWISAGILASGTPLPTYTFSQRVSTPFCGIDGVGRAMKEASWAYEPRNAYEYRAACHGALHLLRPTAKEEFKIQDITTVELADLSTSERYIGYGFLWPRE